MTDIGININDIIRGLNIDPKKLKKIKFSDKEIEKSEKVSISKDIGGFVSLRTKEGKSFFGQHNYSKDEKYLVVYHDEHEENGKLIPGKIILAKNNIVLWMKTLERPNAGFVTNDGYVLVINWLHKDYKDSKDPGLSGKIIIFDEKGRLLLEKLLSANIAGQAISNDETELIITTCNPDNSV